MKNFFRKTILLLTLAGIVFLGGGVGVARGETATTAAPVVAPATTASPAPDTKMPEQSVGVGKSGDLEIIGCGGFWDKIALSCILPVLTYSLYVVTAGVLMLSGYIFDYMLSLSINGEFITQPFVNKIWVVMRDFSNMLFIFILLYTGIRTMLFGDDWKKSVMMVVVIALLINFSLFFTKVVIDAGNILAVGVYSGMGVTKDTSVSAAFTNGFSPQQFFSLSASQMSLAPTIFIIAGVVSGFLAFILFKAAFMFMGRILAFWFLMMWSPIAFIMLAFPQLGAKFKFSFDGWLDILINQAFVAPVFLFFIYVIMTFVQAKVFSELKPPFGAGDLTNSLFVPIVITGMLIYALKKALHVAESMSGEFGKIGASIGNKALGLAAGGAGMALTGGVGGLANKVFESGVMQRMAEGRGGEGVIGKFVGRQGVLLADKTRNATFDARNIKAFGIGKGLGAGAGSKEGFMKKEAAWMKEQDRRAKLMEVTDTEKDDLGFKSKEEMSRLETTKVNAKESVKEAGTKANDSATGKKVTEADNKKTGAVMAGDAAIKKLEVEKKKQATAITDEQRSENDRAVKEAEEAAQRALQDLATAEKELGEAQKIHSSSKEVVALEYAKETLSQITKEIEKGKEVNRAITEGNLYRRGVYGKSVTLHPSGWWNRSKKIDKIRKGPSDEEKAEESMMKSFKKIMEKEKKERGEPTAAKEKSEKPKEEGPLETK